MKILIYNKHPHTQNIEEFTSKREETKWNLARRGKGAEMLFPGICWI
jgi:hypothetical protein